MKDPDLDLAIARAAGFPAVVRQQGRYSLRRSRALARPRRQRQNAPWRRLLFDLLDDREAASFFARMSVAAYDERERGHTGNFFNILWAMPGVSRCGPLATGAYWRETGLVLRPRPRMGRQLSISRLTGRRGGTQKSTPAGTTPAPICSPMPCRSRVSISPAGKPASAPALEASEVDEVIAAGTGAIFPTKEKDRFHYRNRGTDQLLTGLSSWSPAVRKRSARELGKRDGDFMPALLKLLASSDLDSRYGAVEALGNVGSKTDVPIRLRALSKALQADDLWLRILAAKALAGIGSPARTVVPEMLERLARSDPENDPRGMEQRYLSFALFNRRGGLIGRSLEGVDRQLLVEAVRIGLQNQDGRARGSFVSVYRNLTYDEIKTAASCHPTGDRRDGTQRNHVRQQYPHEWPRTLRENTGSTRESSCWLTTPIIKRSMPARNAS